MEDIMISVADLKRIRSEIETLKIKIKINDVNMVREIWKGPNGELFVDNLNDVVKQLDKLHSKIDIAINTITAKANNEGNTDE